MSNEVVQLLKDGVRLIRINRPETKNAFNSTVYKTIIETLNSDATDDSVVATIITGTGEYYSSGFDIKSSMQNFGNNTRGGAELVEKMIEAFINYPKLLIALVNGPAIGIAVTSAALCDIVYASENATFQTPFLKLGLCAEGCSSLTFPSIMGRSKASEMLFLGKTLTAQEAYQCGFVAKVVAQSQIEEFTQELMKLGKEMSVNSVKIMKELAMGHYRSVLLECNKREIKQLRQCFLSEEFSNAILRFINRKSKL